MKRKERKNSSIAFHRCLLFFFFLSGYSQRLRARREPGQNINVDAGDGSAPPLGALAHGGAGIDRLRRSGARTQAEERPQRACYHLHRWMDGLRDPDRRVCRVLQSVSEKTRASSFVEVKKKKEKKRDTFMCRVLLKRSVHR